MAPATSSAGQDDASPCSRLQVLAGWQVLSTSENEGSHWGKQMKLPPSWKFHPVFLWGFFP